MSRWKAASLHLALSIVVICAVGAGLVFLWYGWPLFQRMGGARLLSILAIVDIVIGPLLTLIVFRHGKKSLRFDLTVIALLQLGFLAYGLWIMAQSRPVFLVGLVDRFELVHANDLDPADLAEGKTDEYRTLSWAGPRLVGGLLPQNSDERYELGMLGFSGKDIHLLPRRYIPYPDVQDALVQKMVPMPQLSEQSLPEDQRRLAAFAEERGVPASELSTLPIISRRGRATMVMRASDGEILGPVAVEPWPDLVARREAARAERDAQGH